MKVTDVDNKLKESQKDHRKDSLRLPTRAHETCNGARSPRVLVHLYMIGRQGFTVGNIHLSYLLSMLGVCSHWCSMLWTLVTSAHGFSSDFVEPQELYVLDFS